MWWSLTTTWSENREFMCHHFAIKLRTPHAVSVSSAPADTRRKNANRRADAWPVRKQSPSGQKHPRPYSATLWLTHTPSDRWFTVTEQRPLSHQRVQFPIFNTHLTAFFYENKLVCPRSHQMPSRRTSKGNCEWLLARHNKSPELITLNTLQCGCRRPYRGQLVEVIMYWCTLLRLLLNNSQCIPCDRCVLTCPLGGFGVFLYLGIHVF